MLSTFEKKEVSKLYLSAAPNLSGGADSLLLSYIFTRQACLINPNDTQNVEKFANIFLAQKDYWNAFKSAEKWFGLPNNGSDLDSRGNMFFIKGLSAQYLRRFDIASENLRKAMNTFIQTNNTEKFEEAKNNLENELPKMKEIPNNKPASEKREECIRVKKYLDNIELPDVPGKMVYILPADWLEKWKEYNNYYETFHEDQEKANFMEEEKEKVEWLGPIDPSNILEDIPVLVDTQPDEIYSNFQIKIGLEENKDFYIVNEECWRYLHQKYGGIPVQRPTYRKSENSMNISVEVWLQKINIICLPIPKDKQPTNLKKTDTVFISKTKSIKELSQKLERVYKNVFVKYDTSKELNRLWKLDPRFDIQTAWDKWSGKTFFIEGNILDEKVSIEDAEISDNDTIIFEMQFLREMWFMSNESRTKNSSKENLVTPRFTSIQDFPPGSKKGLTGLQNLGNTCFMNSAIQCLSNTFEATKFFLSGEYKDDINESNPLGSGGRLAHCYSKLMKEMWFGTSSSVSPWELKKTIGRSASQFLGYGQQDSQELLSYLLDGLHEDLNRVKDKPIIETKDEDNRPDEVVAEESWNNHLKRNQSRIQELMHGQFKSRLDCPDCKKISITFDPYMMMSLPIPTNEYTKFFAYFVFESHQKIPMKISFNMPSNTTYQELVDKISQITKVPTRSIVMALLKEHKVVEFVSSSVDAHYLKEHVGILFVYEIPLISYIPNSNIEKKNGSSLQSESNTVDQTMETEGEESNSPLQESLMRVIIQTEAKAFYESDKIVSFTRLIKIDPLDTYRDIHLKIYEKLRHHLYKYFEKQGGKNPILIEERSKSVLEEEYNMIFPEDNEGQWIYKLHLINNSREDPKTGKKPPCELCQKKCNKCLFPNEDVRLSNYLEKMRVAPKDLVIELKINTKAAKYENLLLNQCSQYRGEDDDTNSQRNYNIYDCINLFTRKERLEKDNAWYCSKCKAHKEALKKMEIYKVPPILILHLKRFKTSKATSIGPFHWGHGKKISSQIDFPIEGLDLRSYVLNNDNNAIYDLYAVSNHYGGLSGGHYTALAKNPINGQWYDFNDSRVSSASEKEIVGEAAYVLFYKRRDLK